MIDLLLDAYPCLVVNKPGGILVQSPPGIDSMVDQLRDFERERIRFPNDPLYIGVPHRLDRPASGAMVFARTRRSARELSEQFSGRLVGKEYWVLVEGTVSEARGTWRDTVRKVPSEAQAEIVSPDHPDGKIAVLHYQVERTGAFGSWLRIHLETGRMHQIRLQCSHRGHPVLGDSQYGSTVKFGPQTEDLRARWIALHSRRLTFRHTKTREKHSVTAPVAEPWLEVERAAFWTPTRD